MDEENNENQQENEDSSEPSGSYEPAHQHVHIFGAEVGAGANGGDRAKDKDKEEWRARKEEWKAAHRAQREEWKMHHREWRGYGFGGHLFGGLVLLVIGVLALLYTMGLVSPTFWHAIAPLWPVLFIFWGASIILGRHWAARIVLFILALIILFWIVVYGLVKTDSPLVSSLSPRVVQSINSAQIH